MKLTIALEWFLNPDHLPLIAGVVSGKYKAAGLDVEITQPKEHYDGFEDLKKGLIDIHVNEPLHLFEHYYEGMRSLGCFFETRGGVMIRADRVQKLKEGGALKITTPASNPVTNTIGFEILKRYADKNGFHLAKENVEFVETDFYHIANMKKDESFDGAWLCFYNFEGVEAEMDGFENLFIDQFESPYPNFSALEMISTQDVLEQKGEAICKFLEITSDMSKYLKTHPIEAKSIYYDYAAEESSPLMDKIIEDTLTRFLPEIQADGEKWYDLYKFLEELELVHLSDAQYDALWSVSNHDK